VTGAILVGVVEPEKKISLSVTLKHELLLKGINMTEHTKKRIMDILVRELLNKQGTGYNVECLWVIAKLANEWGMGDDVMDTKEVWPNAPDECRNGTCNCAFH
jgi:hypothetical protein